MVDIILAKILEMWSLHALHTPFLHGHITETDRPRLVLICACLLEDTSSCLIKDLLFET